MVVVPRPNIPWSTLIAIGLTVFTGQFLLQFFGIAYGMPAGLTAVVVQTQALFTVLFATLVIGDRPTSRQLTGMLTAFVGLLMIGLTLGTSIPLLAFALTLASAISWATGNACQASTEGQHTPSHGLGEPGAAASGVRNLSRAGRAYGLVHRRRASWLGLFAPLYLGVLASVFAYAIWGHLLQRYSTGAVAPFALLAPAVGAIASAFITGESFGPVRLAGMGCMLLGLAIVVLPPTCSGLSTVPAPSTTDPAQRRKASGMSTVTIYHNPDCGTSRNTLALIRASSIEPTVIEYVKAPPERET